MITSEYQAENINLILSEAGITNRLTMSIDTIVTVLIPFTGTIAITVVTTNTAITVVTICTTARSIITTTVITTWIAVASSVVIVIGVIIAVAITVAIAVACIAGTTICIVRVVTFTGVKITRTGMIVTRTDTKLIEKSAKYISDKLWRVGLLLIITTWRLSAEKICSTDFHQWIPCAAQILIPELSHSEPKYRGRGSVHTTLQSINLTEGRLL